MDSKTGVKRIKKKKQKDVDAAKIVSETVPKTVPKIVPKTVPKIVPKTVPKTEPDEKTAKVSTKDEKDLPFPWSEEKYKNLVPTGDTENTWKDLEPAVKKFVSFLKDAAAYNKQNPGKQPCWHTVFSMGTVVQDVPTVAEFQGFKKYENYDYPMHRFKKEEHAAEQIISNELYWEKTCKTLSDDAGKVLRRAFTLFVKDGYPYPGGNGSDRGAKSIQKDFTLWMIEFPHRSRGIFNLWMTDGADFGKEYAEASVIGGDMRRYDYLQPRIYAVISPDLEVFYVNNVKKI